MNSSIFQYFLHSFALIRFRALRPQKRTRTHVCVCVCVRVCVCACNCVATSRRLTQRLLLPLLASGIRRGGGLSSAGSDNQAGPSGAASAVSAPADA